MLEVKNLTVRYGPLTLVDNVSFTVEEGERLMIVGPNGAGKSTLVNAITQSIPYTGEVLFEGRNVRSLKPRELACRMGMLMQNHFVSYAFTVQEVVSSGRYAYSRGLFTTPSDEDEQLIAEAINNCGLEPMVNQSVLTLSGGELQRTFLAQVLAQDPRLLVLDEPTNHLDLAYQKHTLELLDGWLNTRQRAVLAVVHDLSLARAFSTRVLLMDKARIVALGTPEETLSPANLKAVYQMDVQEWLKGLLEQWK
ncbi:MAG: ABC transporter ATP-binding protein [Coriobacteriales bacterium]|nr:ABC transporter ATP-binding protein [Coriobacteriales bacterium]